MIILIAGSSHTGKTFFAQKLMEMYKISYLSVDHLKMGLIRCGYTDLTAESDDKELTSYLWPVLSEIIKTNIENNQNLIIEGCYIPFDYKMFFEDKYLKCIKYYCLIFSENYISRCFCNIKKYADIIEKRIDDNYCTKEYLIEENAENLRRCEKYKNNYILIDEEYDIESMLKSVRFE